MADTIGQATYKVTTLRPAIIWNEVIVLNGF